MKPFTFHVSQRLDGNWGEWGHSVSKITSKILQDYISLAYLLFYTCVFTIIISYFRQPRSRPGTIHSHVWMFYQNRFRIRNRNVLFRTGIGSYRRIRKVHKTQFAENKVRPSPVQTSCSTGWALVSLSPLLRGQTASQIPLNIKILRIMLTVYESLYLD